MAFVDIKQRGFCPVAGLCSPRARRCTGTRHVAASCDTVACVERLTDDAVLPARCPGCPPLREGSSGGSNGTAAEGHVLCTAVFPVGVPCSVTADLSLRAASGTLGG